MPGGIPVATVAIDGAENAALLACSILALKYDDVAEALKVYRKELAEA
jgi:5-(carboxyamino)imidazole ribonucleotide mutase